MRREREQMLRTSEHKACGYAACICVPLKHAASCAWRRHVLAVEVQETPPECNCDKHQELARWLAAEAAKTDGLIAAAAAAKGKEAA